MEKKSAQLHLYAVVEIDGDGNRSYTTSSPMGKTEAQKHIKQQRKWAKEDNSCHKYSLKKVYLSM